MSTPTQPRENWKALIFFFVLLFGGTMVATADDPPLKPFHIEFKEYQQDSTDGSYTFTLYFRDVAQSHVHWPDGRGEPKTLFKIDDMIGPFKIVNFTRIIKQPDANKEQFGPWDASELTLANTMKQEEKPVIKFRSTYNLPEAGLPPETK